MMIVTKGVRQISQSKLRIGAPKLKISISSGFCLNWTNKMPKRYCSNLIQTQKLPHMIRDTSGAP